MKKIDITLFAVLFAAVAALFVLYFIGNKPANSNGNQVAASDAVASTVAYVEMDSVLLNFDMFSDKSEELMAKQTAAENQLNAQGNTYQRNAMDYQDKVNKGLVTRAQATEMEQALYQQQQEILALSDQLQAELLEEESVMNNQIMEYVSTYLEENKDIYNYQYILAKSFGGVVLYGDEAHDITQSVIEGLNKKYSAEGTK
jgi:outer membrane protein